MKAMIWDMVEKDMKSKRCRAAELVKAFIDGADRGIDAAGKLENLLDITFPDNLEIQDLVISLASYRPEGGPNLYNEAEMVTLLKKELPVIERLSAQE